MLVATIVVVRALLTPRNTLSPLVLSERSESKGQDDTGPPSRPWTPAEIASVRHALRATFASAIADGVTYSLAVLDAHGRVIYDDRADDPAIPASVQKLVIADTALNLLGPQYRFHTLLASQRGIGS
ncbi:MAG TPA: D-alanyl-D-alanine carboxypeptidase, partial [Candidatus Baltobacteraceae bacterium]|nr:D-alanyl-D-alanine carboxypeptidase [Candidatus Baltobacteraceae bacterium]